MPVLVHSTDRSNIPLLSNILNTVQANIHRQIWNLALPAIVSNITIPLLGLVDTALMGRQEDVSLLGGLAIGSMFFNMVFWAFGFLRIKTTGPTAQAFGRGDQEEMHNYLYRTLAIGLGLGCTLLLFQKPLIWLGLGFFTMSSEVYEAAHRYVEIRIWAAPASLGLFGLMGWFLGMQNARIPLLITVVENVGNTMLSIYFVFFLEWDIAGVAWGSVLASYCALVVGLFVVKRVFDLPLFPPSLRGLLEREVFLRFVRINSDVFIRTLCLIFTYYFFTNISSSSGEYVLAANAILIQLWHVFAYGIDGFANAAESLVGKFVGKNDAIMMRKSVRWTFFWAMLLAGTVSLAYVVFESPILSVFTRDPIVLAMAQSVFLWTVVAPLINALAFVLDGVFLGATRSSEMRNTMVIATFLVFLPVFYLSREALGAHAIWLAMSSYMLARGVGLGWLWIKK